MKTYIFIRHAVKEYSNWRIEFDKSYEWRRSCGEKESQVFRDEDNQNMITVLAEWESMEKAKKFLEDSALSERMQVAGVLEQPIIYTLRKE